MAPAELRDHFRELVAKHAWCLVALGFPPSAFISDRCRARADRDAADSHFVHSGELLQAGAPARDFLIAHPDRVFQSSDLASGCELWGLTDDSCPSEQMAVSQTWTLRAMLETTQEIGFTSAYTGTEVSVTGLGLPQATLKALYHDSVFALLGEPRPIQCGPALVHIDRLIAHTTKADEITRLQEIRAQFVTACP